MKISFVDTGKNYEKSHNEISTKISHLLRSGKFILGENLIEFEVKLAEYLNVDHAIGVGNGSDALVIILKSLGIGGGDEVITCTTGFIATAWAINSVGAKPVFVDSKQDLNIDPEKIIEKITTKTKAIIVVHYAGLPADLDTISDICKTNGLHLIEDAAQAIGSEYKNEKVGSFGIASAFSLHPLKSLSVAGDGGFIATNDKNIEKFARLIRNHGLQSRDNAIMWGLNSRLDEIQAVVGLANFEFFSTRQARVEEIARYYTDNLSEILITPKYDGQKKHSFHRYIVKANMREKLQKFLFLKGIETAVHYPIPIHLQTFTKELGYKVGDFRNSEESAKTILSIPLYPELLDIEVEHIVESISSF
jgi:dTDP-4-amino-4,6-dideoxygalactose transaminase